MFQTILIKNMKILTSYLAKDSLCFSRWGWQSPEIFYFSVYYYTFYRKTHFMSN